MKHIVFWGFLLSFYFRCDAQNYIVGLRKKPNCSGFNICGLYMHTDQTLASNDVLALIQIKDSKRIQFLFTKNSVNDKLFLKHFATGEFILDADFELPDEISKTLNVSHCILKQGKYEVLNGYDSFEVIFIYQ